MPLDLVKAVARYHAALDVRDFAAIEAMFAPGAEYVSPGVGGRLSGRDNILAAFRRYFAEYADQQSTDDDIKMVAPDRVIARWHLVASSSVTGAALARSGEEEVTFAGDGRICRIEVRDR